MSFLDAPGVTAAGLDAAATALAQDPDSEFRAVQNATYATKDSPAFTGTPTGISKTHVGLGSVDNTADSAKPVSTAQQSAITAATKPSNARNPITGWYHVTAFGALGDGTGNDTSAIASASNTGGANATLYFPPGTYIMDGVNVTAAGQTWITHPESILKLKNTSSSFYILKLQNVAGFSLTGVGGVGGTLEGNKTNNASGNMFQMNGVTNFKVKGMTIQNAANWAISLGGCSDGVISENRFFNCNGGVGQAFYHGTYGACTNIEFERNFVDMRGIALGNANTGGFTSYGNVTTPNTNMRLNNNRVYVNKDTIPTNTGCLGMINTVGGQINSNLCVGSGIGITVATNSKWIAVNGNQVRGFFDFGIEFADSQYCGGSGNVVDGAGCNSYPVSISGTSKSINLTGGELYNNTTGKSCINVSSTPTDITLSGVDMTLNGTGTIACVVLNGTTGVTITGGTMNGSTTADAGVKLIGSTGGFISTGVRYKDFATAGVRLDAVSATTVDKVIISSCIKVGSTPVHHTVTGSATLGSNVSITGNV